MQTAVEKSLPASFTVDQRQWLFDEIVRVYDFADEVLGAVALDGLTNRDVQLELATPFITQLTSSANILAAYYTEVAQGNRPITPDLQDTIEKAFRNFFEAMRDLLEGMEEKLMPGGSA